MCIIYEVLLSNGGSMSSRDMGRYLQTYNIGTTDALTQLKKTFGSLRTFLDLWQDVFSYSWGHLGTEFRVYLRNREDITLETTLHAQAVGQKNQGGKAKQNSDVRQPVESACDSVPDQEVVPELDVESSMLQPQLIPLLTEDTVLLEEHHQLETAQEEVTMTKLYAGDDVEESTLTEESNLDEEFEKFTVGKLKTRLKKAGLSQVGRKHQLVLRLLQHTQPRQESSSRQHQEDVELSDKVIIEAEELDDEDEGPPKYGVIVENTEPFLDVQANVPAAVSTEKDLTLEDLDEEIAIRSQTSWSRGEETQVDDESNSVDSARLQTESLDSKIPVDSSMETPLSSSRSSTATKKTRGRKPASQKS
jgi:hypothetical protein